MATLQIGDLTFYGQQHSSRMFFRRLVDWDTLPDSKTPVEERPQDHGSFDGGDDLRSSAVPSFDFMYEGTSRADALRVRQAITGALAVGGKLPMTLTDELGPTTRMVSVRSVKVQDIRNQRVVQGSVDTLAPDPKRYGPADVQQTGLPTAGGGLVYPVTYPVSYGTPGDPGRVTAVNVGTADTYSLIEVTGGLELGFELSEVGTGRRIRFDRPVPLGGTIFLNPRTGRAWLDDPANDVTGSVTRSDWWSVPAGGESVTQFTALGTATGTPTLTVRTAPAYW